MAKLLPTDILKSDLDKINEKIIAEIKDLLATYQSTSTLSKEKLIELISNFDLQGHLDDNGLTDAIQKYLDSFDSLVTIQAGLIAGSVRMDAIINQTELIKESLGNYLLGKASSYTDLLKVNIMQGIMGDLTDSQIADNLKITGLTDAQMNTVIDTSYFNHERSITAEIFSDKPDQKFKYVGDLIETSSPICRWLIKNQKAGGYTRTEIDKNIRTPKGLVNWSGRIPNFNCGHQFLPII